VTIQPLITRPKTNRHEQAGFTLIETLVAMTVGMMLMTTIIGIMYQSARMGEVMEGQIRINQEAREMFLMLLHAGNDSTGNPIAGLRGRLHSGTGVITKSTGRLSIDDVTNGELLSRDDGSITVQCSANDEPVTGCTGTDTIITDGMLAKTPSITADTASVNAATPNRFRWSVVSLDLIDPRVARNKLSATIDYLDTYSTIIYHQKETN
jgi:prepilin-type N-terminal cleavage/methylation domain-containing protein